MMYTLALQPSIGLARRQVLYSLLALALFFMLTFAAHEGVRMVQYHFLQGTTNSTTTTTLHS